MNEAGQTFGRVVIIYDPLELTHPTTLRDHPTMPPPKTTWPPDRHFTSPARLRHRPADAQWTSSGPAPAARRRTPRIHRYARGPTPSSTTLPHRMVPGPPAPRLPPAGPSTATSRRWRRDGTSIGRIHNTWAGGIVSEHRPEVPRASLDSQSVKTTEVGGIVQVRRRQEGRRPQASHPGGHRWAC